MKKCGIIAIFFALILLFSACGNEKQPPKIDSGTIDTPDNVTPTPPDDTDKPIPPDIPDRGENNDDPVTPDDSQTPKENINPLTGLADGISDEALSQRPVAIMIGNTVTALPQWGVSKADIIYEMYAEGRLTRIMAIFQDPSKIDKVASVRSARPYFIDIAQSYGAVFMHFGGSVPAYSAIASRDDLIDIDGIKGNLEGTVFFRDAERRKKLGKEHSVYITGEHIELALSMQTKDITQQDHPSAFTFADESSASAGTDMTRVQISFKPNHNPYFTYDSETKKYMRFQYGNPQVDGLNDQQIAVTNLFIIRMPLKDLGGDLSLIEVDTTGSGDGYYFCGGKYVEITWKKDSYNSPITFCTLDGNPVVCCPGQTFVSVVAPSSKVSID